MLKEKAKNSMVKKSSLLEEAPKIEILGLQSIAKVTGGINIYIEPKCKDKPYANCSSICQPYLSLGCGSI